MIELGSGCANRTQFSKDIFWEERSCSANIDATSFSSLISKKNVNLTNIYKFLQYSANIFSNFEKKIILKKL